MQTSHHFGLYDRAIRTKIGDALRTLFVPIEPAPVRIEELLRALDEPDDTCETEANSGTDKTGGCEIVPPYCDRPLFAAPSITNEPGQCANEPGNTLDKEHVEKIPGGYAIWHADGPALVYLFCGANEAEALQANVLTEDEARRIAISVAKLPRRVKRNG